MDPLQVKVAALDSEVRGIGDSLRNYLNFGTAGVRTVKPPGTKAGRELLQQLLARIEQVSTQITDVKRISSDVSPPLPTGPDTPQSYGSPVTHQQSPVPNHQQQDAPSLSPSEPHLPPPSPAAVAQAIVQPNTDQSLTSPIPTEQRQPPPPTIADPAPRPAPSSQSETPQLPPPRELPVKGSPLLCDHASPLFACTYRDVNVLNEDLFEGYSAHPVVQDRGYFKLQVGDLPPLVVGKMDRPTSDHATSFRYKADKQGNIKVDTGKKMKFSNPLLPFPLSLKKQWTFAEQRDLWNAAARNPPKGSMPYIIGNPLFQDVELAPGEKLKRRGRTVLEGINTQYVYFNLLGKTITTMHREDAHVRSENLLRSGEHKFWCFVKPRSTRRLEEQMKLVYPQMRDCSQAVRHLSLHIPPFQLEKWGVEYTLDYCVPGQAIVTEPGTYHQVLNLGKNYAIAINVEYESSPDEPVDYTFCDDACPDKFAMSADDFKFYSKEPLEMEVEGGEKATPETPLLAPPKPLEVEVEEGEQVTPQATLLAPPKPLETAVEEGEQGTPETTLLAPPKPHENTGGHHTTQPNLPYSTGSLAPPNDQMHELPEPLQRQTLSLAPPSAAFLAPLQMGEPRATAIASPSAAADVSPQPVTVGTIPPNQAPAMEPLQTEELSNTEPPHVSDGREELRGAHTLPGTQPASPSCSLLMPQLSSTGPVLDSPRQTMGGIPLTRIPGVESSTSLQMPPAMTKRATVLPREVVPAAKQPNPFSRPRHGNGTSLAPAPLRQHRAPYAPERFMVYEGPPSQTSSPVPLPMASPILAMPTLPPVPHGIPSPTLERPVFPPSLPETGSHNSERPPSERPRSPSTQNEHPTELVANPPRPASNPPLSMTKETPVPVPIIPVSASTKGIKRPAKAAPAKRPAKKPKPSNKKALLLPPVPDAASRSVPASEPAPGSTPEVGSTPLPCSETPRPIAFKSLAALVQESQKSREAAAAQFAPQAAFLRLDEMVQSWRCVADSFRSGANLYTLIAKVELESDSDDAIYVFLRRFMKMQLADLASGGEQKDHQAPNLENAMSSLLGRLGWGEADREKLYDYIREGRCWKTLCGFDDGLLCIMPIDDGFFNLAVYQQDVQELLAQFQSPFFRAISSAGSELQTAILTDEPLVDFAWEEADTRGLTPDELMPLLRLHCDIAENMYTPEGYEWPKPNGWKYADWPVDPTHIQSGGHCQLCKKRATCVCARKMDGRAGIVVRDGTVRCQGSFRGGKPLGELVGEMVPVGTHPRQWTMEFHRPDLQDQAIAEIYPGRHGNWVRKVNHSLTPSAEFKVLRVGGRWRVVLMALRDLAAGDEITAKYGRGYRRDMAYGAVEGLD